MSTFSQYAMFSALSFSVATLLMDAGRHWAVWLPHALLGILCAVHFAIEAVARATGA